MLSLSLSARACVCAVCLVVTSVLASLRAAARGGAALALTVGCRCVSQLTSAIFAFALLFVLLFTYLYCRTKGLGNLGPDRPHHVDSQSATAANGVTSFATGVSVAGGHPDFGHGPAPEAKQNFAMSEGVPMQAPAPGAHSRRRPQHPIPDNRV